MNEHANSVKEKQKYVVEQNRFLEDEIADLKAKIE
jgi:hypothetical protein